MAARILILTIFLAGVSHAASPAVDAAIELPRERPIHYVDAILALIDLGEPEQARKIADEMAALELTDQQRIELVAVAGTARLLRLAKEAPVVADAVLRARRLAQEASKNPKRVRDLLEKASSGDADEARAAMLMLERSGSTGVELSLSMLGDTKDAKRAARLREVLVALYPESGPALIAAINDPNPIVRAQAAYAWGRLATLDRVRSPLPAALLAGRCLLSEADDPSRRAASWSFEQLTGRPADLSAIGPIESSLDAILTGTLPFPADDEGNLRWLSGDPGQTENLSAREVTLRIAATLADDLAQLRAGDSSSERLANVFALETNRERSAGVRLKELPTLELSECLRLALEKRCTKAAAGCCEILGERRDVTALLAGGVKSSPLVLSLGSPDAGVRFAALEAILAIDSPTPFPGSSRVAEALQYFASGTGVRRAVVVAPQLARAANLAGLLAAAGYKATPFNNGSEAIEAASSPDVELILIDADTLRPSARETLFRLKRTPETAATPIGLLAADGRYGDAQSLAEQHDGVLASPRLHSAEDTGAFAQRLAGLRASVAAEERRQRALNAGEWIAKLLATGPRYYRLRSHAGLVSHTLARSGGDRSFDALAALGTPASQVVLVNAASRGISNIEVRRSAAEAFGNSVRRFGVLLTRDEILRQYDRYNASETADAETQAALGAILDAIESGRERAEEVFAR